MNHEITALRSARSAIARDLRHATGVAWTVRDIAHLGRETWALRVRVTIGALMAAPPAPTESVPDPVYDEDGYPYGDFVPYDPSYHSE
jgi:hypothetical protein